MRKQVHAAVMVKLHGKSPQVGHVARHLRRPTRVVIRPRLPRLRVLDTVRMRGQHRTDRADIEDVGVRAAIEDLRSERMGDGNDGPPAARSKRGEARGCGAQ